MYTGGRNAPRGLVPLDTAIREISYPTLTFNVNVACPSTPSLVRLVQVKTAEWLAVYGTSQSPQIGMHDASALTNIFYMTDTNPSVKVPTADFIYFVIYHDDGIARLSL